MKALDDWAGDSSISIIPAACLMLEAGAAIAAISIQLARLALSITEILLLQSSIQIFFIILLLSDAHYGSCRQTDATQLPLQHAASRAMPAKFLEPLHHFSKAG